jgi:hypothetical protein
VAPDDAVLESIRSLIGADAPLDEIERGLTDGYAYALGLEAERLRLDRRLVELRELLTELRDHAARTRAA